jgi:tryptophanyl-tRNA synthetase
VNKEVILTGIRANNDLHIGNYFGALLPIIDMAKKRSSEYQVNLFIPDLHSFTTPIDHRQLQSQIMNNLKIFAAAGLPLDDPDIHIYRQSYIPAHSELTWILDCFTGFGEMSRMNQFRDKAIKIIVRAGSGGGGLSFGNAAIAAAQKPREVKEEVLANATVGLFNYPVLMASDILLYNAKYVPVGDDQTQHLEFTRDIAERMNKQFGNLFKLPEPVTKQHEFFGNDKGLRVRDLIDPTKKMSKSDNTGKGVIFLGDKPDDAAKKIMNATTDSLNSIKPDYENQPGITNLLSILNQLPKHQGKFSITDPRKVDNYKQLKEAVAETVKNFLTDFQKEFAQVDEEKLIQKLESDEKAMKDVANNTLLKVQKAVGLRPA